MAMTNTFHTSKAAHAIRNGKDAARVQRHNSRGYFSMEYDRSKIHSIVGEADEISWNIEDYINNTFQKNIDDYNERQVRKDRKIDQTAYEYFCENKNLDIANEMIFQIGDMDFWERWREEEVRTTRKGKEIVIKSFPEEVKNVMDDIFLKQAEAYETIYETHGAEILKKIEEDYKKAEGMLGEYPAEESARYLSIIAEKNEKKREKKIKGLEDKERFYDFWQAEKTVTNIEKLKLRERIGNGDMKIKLLNLDGHYDEWSPHAHGVSVCSAGGYASGLSERVAKSVVLNKYALEVIQERMHEIALEEMVLHPEIFAGAELEEKKPGRNQDYSKELYVRMQQEKLERETKILDIKVAAQKKSHAKNNEILQKQDDQIREWNDELDVIQDEKEYVAQGKLGVDILQNLSGSVDRLVNRSGMLRDRKLEESLKNAFRGYSEALNDIVDKLCKYEIAYQVEELERLSSPIVTAKKNLEDQMNAAKRRKLTEEELAERIAENYLRYAEERSLTESETLTEALFKFAAVIITKGEIDFVTEEEREKCTNRAVELAAKIIEKRERNFQNQEFHH